MERNHAALAQHFSDYVHKGLLQKTYGGMGGEQYRITLEGHRALKTRDADFIAALQKAQTEYGDRSFKLTLAALGEDPEMSPSSRHVYRGD